MNIEQENFVFDRFRSAFYKGHKYSKTESPDFLVYENGELLIGIELTEIPNKKRKGSKYSDTQRFSFEDSIAKSIKNLFYINSNVPLIVMFDFDPYMEISAKHKKAIIRYTAKLMNEATSDIKGIEPSYHSEVIKDMLPIEIGAISFDYCPYFVNPELDSIWNPIRSKFVEPLTSAYIQEIICKKGNLLESYNRKVNNVILIIVEGFLPVSWFGDFDETFNVELMGFEKVYLYRRWENIFYRL